MYKIKKIKGINYIIDEQGKKTAVVISLKNYKEEIEDFLDGLEAQSRVGEPSVDFEKAVTKLSTTNLKIAKYQLKIKKSAEKEFASLPLEVIPSLKDHIRDLSDNAYPNGYKKLKGFKNLYRIRSGTYRIIYLFSIENVSLKF